QATGHQSANIETGLGQPAEFRGSFRDEANAQPFGRRGWGMRESGRNLRGGMTIIAAAPPPPAPPPLYPPGVPVAAAGAEASARGADPPAAARVGARASGAAWEPPLVEAGFRPCSATHRHVHRATESASRRVS